MVIWLQRLWSAWWVAVLCGFAMPGHATEPISVRDDQGRAIQLQAAPRRIVSLLPSLTETVCVLGACDRLVGVDRWSNWPASVQNLTRVGGLDDANVEAIVALRPDLVLASPSSRLADRLRSLHVQVAEFEAQSLDDVPRILKGVGLLLGRPEQAVQAWSHIQRQLETAAAQVPARAKGTRLYFEVATTPYAAGESSFIGQLWSRLAGRNIIPASMGPFPKINPEYVVRADPDLIILPKADAAGLMRRPGWDRMRAVRQGNVCRLAPADYDLMARPGPRLGQAAGVLLRCLQAHAQRLESGR
ncbi:MAG TPA: helical backbone metal receptor [Aquabacterium sp.]|nr:helical backbone metal receptor [Aquabacterium sp.]